MAFPFVFEDDFESGDLTGWDTAETDTDGKASVKHFTRLAGYRLHPYRGAYGYHIDLTGGTNDAFAQENTDFDMALDAVNFLGFAFYASRLTMAASDRFTIARFRSGGATDEAVVCIRNNAGTIEVLASETGASATVRATHLVQDKWHWAELRLSLDDGVSNDGTIDFYLDGVQVGAQITALDQAAITDFSLGAIGLDAGTTAGHLVFGPVVFDNTDRVFPPPSRFPQQRIFTKSGHAFVGPGAIADAALLSTTAGESMTLWDTDVANSDDEWNKVREIAIGGQTSTDGPIWFERGCYVQLAGTAPRGQVTLNIHQGQTELSGPLYYSNWGYLHYGHRRTPINYNV